MFSFRNKLSPTTSTLLKLNRSPCTITVHQWSGARADALASTVRHAIDLHAALAPGEPAARTREAAAIRLTIELLQDAIRNLEQGTLTNDRPDTRILAPDVRLPAPPSHGNGGGPPSAARNGFGANAALLLGVAGALIAAGTLTPNGAAVRRLSGRGSSGGATASLPVPARH